MGQAFCAAMEHDLLDYYRLLGPLRSTAGLVYLGKSLACLCDDARLPHGSRLSPFPSLTNKDTLRYPLDPS
jgi:hypothetical protein